MTEKDRLAARLEAQRLQLAKKQAARAVAQNQVASLRQKRGGLARQVALGEMPAEILTEFDVHLAAAEQDLEGNQSAAALLSSRVANDAQELASMEREAADARTRRQSHCTKWSRNDPQVTMETFLLVGSGGRT
jgi:hypothetical protein